MSVPARLAAFGAVLALLFGGGALAGELLGPEPQDSAAAAAHPSPSQEHDDMTPSSPAAHDDAADVHGLAVAQRGLRLVVDRPELELGRPRELAFRVLDERGETVRDFDVEHTKRMHLIVARRDLATFQHLHPEQRADGSWATNLRLDDAGSYRLFADFTTSGDAVTLAADLRVDGDADLRPLPAPSRTAVSDGDDDVALDAGDVRPGQAAQLRFTVTRDGTPVATEPYLGAGGHLVALRDGDLAYLHVHPAGHDEGDAQASRARADGSIGFAATFPTAGRYRLFLQFQHDGRVHTVAFTQEVDER